MINMCTITRMETTCMQWKHGVNARKTHKQWSTYNFRCALQFVMKTTTVQSTVFCTHDDKYVHDYSHGNNLHARGSVVVITSAWHAAGRWFDSRTRHVSLLGVKTWLSTGIVYLWWPIENHDSNVTWLPSRNKAFFFFFLHAMKTWSECMHMNARKTCKRWSKYNFTCVLQFVMKTTTV